MNKPDQDKIYKLFRNHPVVSTDSRNIPHGCLYFALKGERFNGNQFALEALDNGAAFAVVDEEIPQDDDRLLKVDDVLTTLQQLAHFHRKQFNIPVIGITGTNGKTTTKELIHAVLSTRHQTLATTGNLNNHIGVPLTLLRMNEQTGIAVIEMGANHPGEIRTLCEIASPNHGIITNIGKAHLEGFGGFGGVIRAKSELYHYLREHKGKVFLNSGNPLLTELSEGISCYSYSSLGGDGCSGKILRSDPFLEVMIKMGDETVTVKSHLTGRYNMENMLAAACIGYHFNVPPLNVKEALEKYSPDNSRSQVVRTEKNVLIMDAYNANPSSMKVALENLGEMKAEQKAAFLGDMLELGEESEAEHYAIIEQLKTMNLGMVILIGPVFTKVNDHPGFFTFNESKDVTEWLHQNPVKGFTILVKGSRGIKMENICSAS